MIHVIDFLGRKYVFASGTHLRESSRRALIIFSQRCALYKLLRTNFLRNMFINDVTVVWNRVSFFIIYPFLVTLPQYWITVGLDAVVARHETLSDSQLHGYSIVVNTTCTITRVMFMNLVITIVIISPDFNYIFLMLLHYGVVCINMVVHNSLNSYSINKRSPSWAINNWKYECISSEDSFW